MLVAVDGQSTISIAWHLLVIQSSLADRRGLPSPRPGAWFLRQRGGGFGANLVVFAPKGGGFCAKNRPLRRGSASSLFVGMAGARTVSADLGPLKPVLGSLDDCLPPSAPRLSVTGQRHAVRECSMFVSAARRAPEARGGCGQTLERLRRGASFSGKTLDSGRSRALVRPP